MAVLLAHRRLFLLVLTRLILLLVCIGISNASPTPTTIPTTTPVTTIPQRPEGSCEWEGEWYENGVTISQAKEYATVCESGSVVFYDGYYCFFSPTTTPHPTTIPPEHRYCNYNSEVYRNNDIILRIEVSPDCEVLTYCHYGEVLQRVVGENCDTTIPPITIPPTTAPSTTMPPTTTSSTTAPPTTTPPITNSTTITSPTTTPTTTASPTSASATTTTPNIPAQTATSEMESATTSTQMTDTVNTTQSASRATIAEPTCFILELSLMTVYLLIIECR